MPSLSFAVITALTSILVCVFVGAGMFDCCLAVVVVVVVRLLLSLLSLLSLLLCFFLAGCVWLYAIATRRLRTSRVHASAKYATDV